MKLLCNEEKVGLIGLLDTKIKKDKMEIKKDKMDQLADKMFSGWHHTTNLDSYYNGRIWITWRPCYYRIIPLSITAQIVTCEVYYNPLQLTFVIFCVYTFNIKEERKG